MGVVPYEFTLLGSLFRSFIFDIRPPCCWFKARLTEFVIPCFTSVTTCFTSYPNTTTCNVECYVDRIEIDADPEVNAVLERIKQMSF